MPTTASDARREISQLLRQLSSIPPRVDREIDERLVRDIFACVSKIEKRVGRLVAPQLRLTGSVASQLCRAAQRVMNEDERTLLTAAIAGLWLPRGDAARAEHIASAFIALQASAILALRKIAESSSIAGVGANDLVMLTGQRCITPNVGSVTVTELGRELLAHVADWQPAERVD